MSGEARRTVPLDEARRIFLGNQAISAPLPTYREALRRVVAVQTQYAASLEVALAARSAKLDPKWEARALAVDGDVVKAWSLRNTLHAHDREDHPLLVAAIGGRAYDRYADWMGARRGFSREAIAALEDRIEEALQAGSLSRRELHERVPELARIEGVGWGLDVMGLAHRGRLGIVGRGAEQRFARMEAAAPAGDAPPELLRRYLASCAPATVGDFAYWTGLRVGEAAAVFQAIRDELVEIAVEGLRGSRYVLAGTAEAPKPSGAALLAKFDPATMAHRDKSLLLTEDEEKRVFRKAGQVEAMLLLNGRPAGTWRLARKARRLELRIEPWRSFGKREAGAVERSAARLAKALGFDGADVRVEARSS